jgi:hypothetical protein
MVHILLAGPPASAKAKFLTSLLHFLKNAEILQMRVYACVGQSQAWCSGYNEGFRASNGGSNIAFGPNTGQSTRIDVHGNNNKISIDQHANSQLGDTGVFSYDHKGNSRTSLPKCVILCFNSNIKIN